MTIRIVEMRAAPGRRREFLALCREGVPRAVQAGCLHAEILADADDPDIFVVMERWPSEEVFQAFAATEWADNALMMKYGELAVGAPRLRRFEAT